MMVMTDGCKYLDDDIEVLVSFSSISSVLLTTSRG